MTGKLTINRPFHVSVRSKGSKGLQKGKADPAPPAECNVLSACWHLLTTAGT